MKLKKLTFWFFALSILTACPTANDLKPLEKVVVQPRAAVVPKVSADFDFCLRRALTRADHLKLIFILDKSGSNAGDATTPGSDPNGARRYGTLLSYLNTIPNENQPNTFYSLIEFSTDISTATNFTNNLTSFINTVRAKSNPFNDNPPNPRDAGWTDYLAALNRTKALIQADITASAARTPPVVSHYVVFFVSDGAPLVPTGIQPTASILNLVRDIRSFEITTPLLVASVQLHTGYYFIDAIVDASARLLMQQMAAAGNGDAFQFSTGQSIDFSRFQIPENNVKFALKDFVVDYDEGTWEDGKFVQSSSADGLSDELKERIGADPNKRDSDANGIPDLVEYRAFGRPCRGNNCEPELATAFPECVNVRAPSPPGVIVYLDSDNDGLDDCSERILQSNPSNFDSSGNWQPDFFALKRGLGLQAGQGGLMLDSDNDRVPAYYELKWNTPLDFPNDQIEGLSPYSYKLKVVSNSAVQDCFHMTVSNIPFLNTSHHLRAYLMEMPTALEAKKYLRTAVKPIGANLHPTFVDGDFR